MLGLCGPTSSLFKCLFVNFNLKVFIYSFFHSIEKNMSFWLKDTFTYSTRAEDWTADL